MFVGKILGITALGFYRYAYLISTLVTREVGQVFGFISYPAYAKLQDNKPKLKIGFLKTNLLNQLITFPLSGWLFILAPEFTRLILGEKWLPIVPAMQILCLRAITASIETGSLFKSVGKPDIITKFSLINLGIIILTIYPLTMKFGIAGTAVSVLFPVFLLKPFSLYLVKKIIDCSAKELIKIFCYPLVGTLIMVFIIFVIKYYIDFMNLFHLFLLGLLGVLIYASTILIMDKIFKEHNFSELIRDFRQVLQ